MANVKSSKGRAGTRRTKASKPVVDPRRWSQARGRRAEAVPVPGDVAAPWASPTPTSGGQQIGIASTWANLTPCNMHINTLAAEAEAGANAAGGKGVLFNTITVSDGISMGSPGMRYSLVSAK
jgi:dihydroxyacid dehydratase/phosphogluconate dehydratase